jgi:hypothetical protein
MIALVTQTEENVNSLLDDGYGNVTIQSSETS